jgi:hypothetical protein
MLMAKMVELNKIEPGIVYYTDAKNDCEVVLNRIENKTIFFTQVSTNDGGYIHEEDGTICFPLTEGLYFEEKQI